MRLLSNRPVLISKRTGRQSKTGLTPTFCCLALLQIQALTPFQLAAASPDPAQSPKIAVAGQARRRETAASSSPAAAKTAAEAAPHVLKGAVSHEVCPFKEDGSTETISQGTTLNLTVTTNLNSELNQEGDEIVAELASDLSKDGRVLLPGKWKVVGRVTRVEKLKRMGRDGFIELKFEKLVSPDGKWEVPLDAAASTKRSAAKTAVKQTLETSGYVSVGAIGGSLLSVQLTGLPVAISTYGISVGVGAAVGGALGMAAALHRKGDTLCAYAGEEIKISLPHPIVVPVFKQEILPSKRPPIKSEDLKVQIRDYEFLPYPFEDKKSRLLKVTFRIENHGSQEFAFSNLALVCNHHHHYLPYCAADDFYKQRSKVVGPNAVQEATLTFQVGSPRLKYSLVLLDRGNENILSEVAIN